jgi:hypothetical protein
VDARRHVDEIKRFADEVPGADLKCAAFMGGLGSECMYRAKKAGVGCVFLARCKRKTLAPESQFREQFFPVKSKRPSLLSWSRASRVHEISRETVCECLRLLNVAGLESRGRNLDPEVSLLGKSGGKITE